MPLRIKKLKAWRFLMEVVRRYGEDQSSVLAGYIAYASMLSGFPFLIFTTALAGLLIGEEHSADAISTLFDAVPNHVALTLAPVLEEVIGRQSGGILTISALGSIYAASNGVEAIRIGLDRAYDVPSCRGFISNRLISIAFVFVGFLVFGALATLIIFAPLIFHVIETWTPIEIPAEADLARYLVGGTLLFWFLWLMHKILPSRAMGTLKIWPGILTSMVLWVALATALSVYVAYSPSYTVTYGALAGVVVTLLFFYLTGVAIIFGAQVNAVVNFGLPDMASEETKT